MRRIGAYRRLVEWKRHNQHFADKTAMLVEGPPGVGKSRLVKDFAMSEYGEQNVLYLDFSRESRDVFECFENLLTDIDTFFRFLWVVKGKRLQPQQGIVIFDEVQECPLARQAIKRLVADGRYDYLEAGTAPNDERNVRDIIIPSEEESLTLRPMGFGEFLEHMDCSALAGLIRDSFQQMVPLPGGQHLKAIRLFRDYMIAGGMPEAVERLVEGGVFDDVEAVKRGVIGGWRSYIADHKPVRGSRTMQLWESIPEQLLRGNERLKLSEVNRNARIRDYRRPLFWLEAAGFIDVSYRFRGVGSSAFDLVDFSRFRCYLADTGLLTTLAVAESGFGLSDFLAAVFEGALQIGGVSVTALLRNAVVQCLEAAEPALQGPFYLQTESKNGTRGAVADFVIDMSLDWLEMARGDRRPDADEDAYIPELWSTRSCPVEVRPDAKALRRRADTIRRHLEAERMMRGAEDDEIGPTIFLTESPLELADTYIALPLYMAHLL